MNSLEKRCYNCKCLSSWSENQSPMGSGEYWPMDFEECSNPKVTEFEETTPEEWNEHWGDREDCPFFIPRETAICGKHGEYFTDQGCCGCIYEAEQACEYGGYLAEGEY